MTNPFIEHFKQLNRINRGEDDSNATVESLKKKLKVCITHLRDADGDNDKLQLMNMYLQLQAAIAILTKLDEIHEEVKKT